MAGYLMGLVMLVGAYTFFAPILLLNIKHLKYGLLMLLAIGAFAFVLHLAGQL